jgi:hypothetical protein
MALERGDNISGCDGGQRWLCLHRSAGSFSSECWHSARCR